MSLNLDLALLRSFVTVAELGSMTAAANALHLTQGAVSQQMKRLEALFGAGLFGRDRRGLRLTQAGERLLGQARRMVAMNDAIWADMTGKAVKGAVRLGAPHDLVGTCLVPILKRFAECHAQVELALSCASSPGLAELLGRGEIDLAVIEQPLDQAGGECLSVERLVWVGASGGGAYLKQPLPVSMVAETCTFRPAVLAALHDHGRAWRTVFENGSLEATTAIVRTDLAVTAWLAPTMPPGLAILPAGPELPDLPPFAITLHGARPGMPPAVAEMARHIRQALGRPPLGHPGQASAGRLDVAV